ncbi:PIR Superfamily Protein [Plasmodium ovale wallikeri]|uniref:PIR Superfamily Protein n=1 Tax=Plasmodium ovale wallikeri TaxID=864142 RepID=A0A1A9A7S9_PLAOA|nr:PIR Superfamily Protein [Plasmodium ovale wallikeri]SBT58326.1 PIR Superfamily Protein [Plasmodium ovale wallikeri]
MDDDYDNIFGLTSIRCYNQLDKNFVSSGNYEKCSKFNNDSDDYSSPYLLCLRLTGNLNNYEKLNFFDELNSYKCNYLNLWAYYQFSKFDKNEHSKIRKLILDNWRESGKFQECDNTEFLSYLSKSEDYLKAKRLYDYALNYYKLKRHHVDNNIPCTSEDKEYIDKSIKLYTGINSECEGNKNELKSYCKAYKVIKEIHPHDELLNIECKQVEDERGSSRVHHTGPGGREEHRLQVAAESSSLGPLASEDTSSSDSYKAIGTSLPMVAVLSIGFVLYKFTGLGTMARNLLRTKGINGMNSHEELTHELLESTYDDQAHPGITETYISYQAT